METCPVGNIGQVEISPEGFVDLQLSAEPGQSCTVVHVAGELDMDTGKELQDFLADVTESGARRVILDFAGVTFLDSSGLGALMVWFKDLRARGGRVCLAAVQAPVRYVLTLSAVDQVVPVHDTVDVAEADLRSVAP